MTILSHAPEDVDELEKRLGRLDSAEHLPPEPGPTDLRAATAELRRRIGQAQQGPSALPFG